MKPYCYSPFPAADYRITALPTCEVNEIIKMAAPEATALWNLFWLSLPAVDVLPVHGKSALWSKHYLPRIGANRAITLDAIGDEATFRKLQMHPLRFLRYFEREDHSSFMCYDALGGDAWVQNVLKRSEVAAARMAHEVPALRSDNIYGFAPRRNDNSITQARRAGDGVGPLPFPGLHRPPPAAA